ncbi:hypothetical protein HHL16_04360 [Pseudoflavitalea sp. G-6-1-2]|uniref:hypothetical protein n=1 Tax=Pseudoflavitalea sp. G-6-1-2 TaxID=2728841 RepID=UPI00146A624E|nr:hypothetical protein [Pseudoflavitalea sp. G-6-1-2]NML20092.1 hypothetical protein [Pseudoflavitalea sp. G-6-1-2]
MFLSGFTNELINTGRVSVAGSLISFEEEDKRDTVALLENYYRQIALDCPGTVPAFMPDVAVKAAAYFYSAVQLVILRDVKNEALLEYLQAFSPASPEDHFSADLVFNHLPALLDLAFGLAPADILVTQLKQMAVQWPLSSVGIELETVPDDTMLFSHPALQQLYIDRIIAQKDKWRASSPHIKQYITETTGEYTHIFWPEFEDLKTV